MGNTEQPASIVRKGKPMHNNLYVVCILWQAL